MASPSHFLSPSLSKVFSQSKSISFTIPNPNPNFTNLTSNFYRFSSSVSSSPSSSTLATTPPFKESDSRSLGDIARPDFPILHQRVNGCDLIYLDNAATSQKPRAVLKALNESYNLDIPNGINNLSTEATEAYKLARAKVAAFINAVEAEEVLFTRNATEAINLVAYSWGLSNLRSGDEILLTVAEHHSNIVPWQLIAQKTGATLKYVCLTEEEIPDIEQLKKLLSTKTKLVATHHVSNTLGSVMPISEIVAWSHDVGAKVLVDACQSVPHMVVDVQKLNADFLVASSHKMCGPTGVGFLYGKREVMSTMAPLGDSKMISDVFLDNSTFAEPPSRFETGTPAIAQAIGLGAAVDYLSSIGIKRIHDYEHGVAIRSGHHCAQLLHRSLGINASARASLYFYNTKEDVDNFVKALKETVDFFNAYL